jgi:lipoprotein-anchoring transpeptidase ErfK/SrfK
VIRAFKIGVGRAVTPTPTGTYFITELLKQPDPAGPYGPFAYGLSAYSGVLSHFGRGGNGQIGIHGTDEPQFVGTNVSHGCIRLRNPDILWLRQRLPLGTPVSISRA